MLISSVLPEVLTCTVILVLCSFLKSVEFSTSVNFVPYKRTSITYIYWNLYYMTSFLSEYVVFLTYFSLSLVFSFVINYFSIIGVKMMVSQYGSIFEVLLCMI